MGIALDLTIETLEGKELEMQTDMHDLSVYSTIWHDNSEALVLESIMKDAGFGGLTSEWWHFQDNETRDALSLNIYMYNGVSAEGWIADDTGWRYRRADGSFVTGQRRDRRGQLRLRRGRLQRALAGPVRRGLNPAPPSPPVTAA